MKKRNILLLNIFFLIPVASLHSQIYSKIILSEIMFKPVESNGEFIEIYNSSATESFNLDGYKIKYATSSAEAITSQDHKYEIAPNSFAVIFVKDYDPDSGLYKDILQAGVLRLTLQDNSFGSSGMSNSSDNAITLLNNYGEPIAIYTYTADNDYGISDEKIILDRNDEAANWKNSVIYNGTPGYINSVTTKVYDIAIQEFNANSSYCVVGESDSLKIKLKNYGTAEIDSFSLVVNQLFPDTSSIEISQQVFQSSFYNLSPSESLIVNVRNNNFFSGTNKFTATVSFTEDEFLLNNILSLEVLGVVINELTGDIVINEIQYAPPDEEPEWIELFNRSDKEINLLNYKIADKSTSQTILTEPLYLSSGEYLLISADSSVTEKYEISSRLVVAELPSLNNSGDEIVLSDSLGRVIDSLEYNPAWGGGNGKSLERIDPFGDSNESGNWKSSRNNLGATPGSINSVTQKEYDLTLTSFVTSPRFPVFNDAVTLSVRIKNIGKQESEGHLELYSANYTSAERVLLETGSMNTLSPGDSLEYVFDYTINNLVEENFFMIIVNCESDLDTLNNILYVSVIPGYRKNSVIVNEIMYNPENGEPEWVEFYNNSEYKINLRNWTISDILTNPVTAVIADIDLFLEPKTYLVVAKDPAVYNFHNEISSEVVILSFANLNNDEDGILLKDSRGQTIDSVKYEQTWGGRKGYSLERKDWNVLSTQQTNWSPSTDLEQSTPGRINSVTIKDSDLAIKAISIFPRFPVIEDTVYITVVIKNYGRLEAQEYFAKFLYTINDAESVLTEYHGNLILPGDSVVIKPEDPIVLTGTTSLRAEVEFLQDWDTQNNFAEIIINPGYPPASLLINEILYNPPAGMPECFELINNSEETINLKNWSVSDLLTTPTKNIITYVDCFVEPGELIVISSNSYGFETTEESHLFKVGFGTLGNTRDGLIIYDYRDAIIDSVMYENTWGGGNGRSLERLSLNEPTCNSSNWTTSLSIIGNTIGRINSCNYIEPAEFMSVVFNEIMFDPAEENSEYIEIYNRSNEAVEIGGWTIADESNNEFELSQQSRLLMPGEYFVLAADSSIMECYPLENNCEKICIIDRTNLSLSNDCEKIYLRDLRGNCVDSVLYSCEWHNKNILTLKNKSLEKINQTIPSNDAANWSTSVCDLGGTPGRVNSIFTERKNNTSKIDISPNPFSPDSDGFEDFTIINYSLTHDVAQLRMKVFDSKGRFVRELLNNQPSGANGSIIFDGMDNDGRPLKIGIYIVFIEALNSLSGVVDVLKDVVVVARKL